MDIREIVGLSEEQRAQVLAACPPPDRYILQSSSNTMTEEQLQQFYKETKSKADAVQTIEDASPIDVTSPEFITFAERYTKDVINELMNNNSIGKEGQMAFVLGSPGAGKSSAIKTEKEKLGAWHADADEIKNKIHDELGVDINHPEIHKASGFVMKNYIIPALLANKINFIQEKIGDEVGKMVKYSEDYVSQGYEVSLSLVHCDYNVCRQRNCNRCLDSIKKGEAPRLVEDASIVEYGNSPMETYIYLMENMGHLFASGTAYCSDGPDKHTPPQVLESICYENGERIMNANTQEYISQGKELKQKAVILVTKSIMVELENLGRVDLSKEVYDAIKVYLTGNNNPNMSPQCRKLVSVINQKASQLLISILNPTKNVRGVGEKFNISKLEQAMLNEITEIMSSLNLSQELESVNDVSMEN